MVKDVQCDNGREFDNSSTRTFFLAHGVHLRMSCPYTSPQNGKAERMIRTINNAARSLLFQVSMPPCYWVEALHTATHVLNILPTKTLKSATPHSLCSESHPHMVIFGFLVVYAILTFRPQQLTSLLLDQNHVFSRA